MPNYFIPRFPFYNSRPYYSNPKYYKTTTSSKPPSQDTLNTPTCLTNISNVDNISNKKDPIFEIFGIKLFFDDILILSLLFFLYSEGLKDEMLFIALILLLLS